MAEHDREPRAAGSDDRLKHRCPICQRAFVGEIETHPFCSRRCRMVDLGRWFNGDYAISRPIRADDEEDHFA